MQAASRAAYGAVAERVADYAREAGPEASSRLADELRAVAGLLAGEVRLRRALADPARAEADRAGLARSLLDGKLSEEAVGLVEALVRGRWSVPSDLLDATERLAVDSLLAGADRAGELGDVEDELFRFGQIVSGDPALVAALGDSTADPHRRAELLHSLLDGKAREVTVRLAELSLTGFGGRGFQSSLTRLVELAAQRRDRQVAYVTTAVALTDAEEERLVAKLSRMYGRKVSLKIILDEKIIGGMSVRVGSDLYDGTVSRRLQQAQAALSR